MEYAQFLHDASEVKIGVSEWLGHQLVDVDGLILCVPQIKPNVEIPVIALYLK